MIILSPLGMNKLPSTSCCMDNILSLGAKYNQCCPQPPQYLYNDVYGEKEIHTVFSFKIYNFVSFFIFWGEKISVIKAQTGTLRALLQLCSCFWQYHKKKYNFSHISWIIIIRIRLKINTIKYLIVYILLNLPGSL